MIAGASEAVVRRLDRGELSAFQAGMPAWNASEYGERLALQDRGLAAQLVAWIGDDPVGKAMVVFPGNPEWSESAYRESCPEIRDLAVDDGWVRRGIGTALVAASEAEARAAGFDRIGLGVGLEASYTAARSLYERLGYRTAHGPFVSGALLDRDDGSSFPVAGVCMYLVKDLPLGGAQPS